MAGFDLRLTPQSRGPYLGRWPGAPSALHSMLGLVVRNSARALREFPVCWKRGGLDLLVIKRPSLHFQGVCVFNKRTGAQEKQPVNYNSRHPLQTWVTHFRQVASSLVEAFGHPKNRLEVFNLLTPLVLGQRCRVTSLWPHSWEGSRCVNLSISWSSPQHCVPLGLQRHFL